MTDREALTRSVCENPADDTPRLVLADWLDEHAGEVECGRCGGSGGPVESFHFPNGFHVCPACSGTGRVPDHFAARAEFIRMQVELARLEAARATMTPEWVNLRERERKLWDTATRFAIDTTIFWPVTVRRGFVAEVACTAADFGRHAKALFAAHPITEVRLTDKYPEQHTWAGGTNYSWYSDGLTADAATIREELLDFLAGGYPGLSSGRRAYDSERDAVAALSAACIVYGRSLAGLSPLIPVQPGEAVG